MCPVLKVIDMPHVVGHDVVSERLAQLFGAEG